MASTIRHNTFNRTRVECKLENLTIDEKSMLPLIELE